MSLLQLLARTGDPVARWASARPGDDHPATMERIRERGRLVPSRIGALTLTGHADCATVLGDPRFGVRTADGGSPRATPLDDAAFAPLDWSLLDLDPPDHSRLRRLVAPAFRPSLMRPFRARVEALCDGLVDRLEARLADGGTVDLMAGLRRAAAHRRGERAARASPTPTPSGSTGSGRRSAARWTA